MKPYVYIKNTTPFRLPVWPTLLAFYLIERFHASDLVIGILVAIGAIVWGISIYGVCTQKGVNLLNEDQTKIRKEFL